MSKSHYPRLTDRLLALSESDDYEEAKHEWRITGRVWRLDGRKTYDNSDGIPTQVRHHPSNHPSKCLCGHPIVYHFEIENTLNGTQEIVGSTCIGNWMVLRHMSEKLNIPRDTITEEMIEAWKEETVQGLVKDAWWEENGEEFQTMFDEVKDLDLRINVRQTGKNYFDDKLKMYRPITKIRKTSSGRYGSADYKMSSIVWRWNHPDNNKSQINRKGYPDDKLMNDIHLFSAMINEHIESLKDEDTKIANRKNYLESISLSKKDDIIRMNQLSSQEKQLAERCEYYGIQYFTADNGNTDWERTFLNDMRLRLINYRDPTTKQLETLMNILQRDKEAATQKQIAYLRNLGYEGDYGTLTKASASKAIDDIHQKRRSDKNE